MFKNIHCNKPIKKALVKKFRSKCKHLSYSWTWPWRVLLSQGTFSPVFVGGQWTRELKFILFKCDVRGTEDYVPFVPWNWRSYYVPFINWGNVTLNTLLTGDYISMSTASENSVIPKISVIILTVYISYIVYKIVLTSGPCYFNCLFNKYLLIEVKHSDRSERKGINSEQGNLRLL